MTFFATAALLLVLAGCAGSSSAPPPNVPPATEVARSVEQDGKFISLVGPRRQHAEPFLGVPSTNFYALRSWLDTRNDEVTCNPGCSYAEEFAAALPEALLRANLQGLIVTFTAKSGADKTLIVPG